MSIDTPEPGSEHAPMRVVVVGGKARSLVRARGPMLRAMRAAGHQVDAVAPDAPASIRAELAAMGVTLHAVPLDRTGLNPARDLGSVAALVGLLRRLRPDAVFLYNLKPVLYGAFAAQLAGVPRRYAMLTGIGHSFLDGSPRGRVLEPVVFGLYRAALATTHGVFFQNPDDRDDLLARGVVRSSQRLVLVNGSGIDLTLFTPSPPPVHPLVFLWLGRLLRIKRLGDYAEAARHLRAARPGADVSIRILGLFDPNPTSYTREEVAEWERTCGVVYIGADDDVRPHLAACSVLVYPSLREGTPRAVLEALACGRAVITTDVPGCRHTVQPGENGFLVPARDPAALAEAMLRFVDDPGLVRPMGQRSRALAQERFDVDRVNAIILETMGL